MKIHYEVQTGFCKDNEREKNGEFKKTPRQVLWINTENIQEVDIIKEMIPDAKYLKDGLFMIEKYL